MERLRHGREEVKEDRNHHPFGENARKTTREEVLKAEEKRRKKPISLVFEDSPRML
jgi:hypothetical protein